MDDAVANLLERSQVFPLLFGKVLHDHACELRQEYPGLVDCAALQIRDTDWNMTLALNIRTESA